MPRGEGEIVWWIIYPIKNEKYEGGENITRGRLYYEDKISVLKTLNECYEDEEIHEG